VEEATWLSPIVVAPKKKWKVEDMCGFPKLQCSYQKFISFGFQ
jgi:hypothetical protein